MSFSKVQMSNLCYLSIQNTGVRTTFGFSLYAVSLLVVLVTYFGRNIIGKQVYWKMRDMSLLTLEVGYSFC